MSIEKLVWKHSLVEHPVMVDGGSSICVIISDGTNNTKAWWSGDGVFWKPNWSYVQPANGLCWALMPNNISEETMVEWIEGKPDLDIGEVAVLLTHCAGAQYPLVAKYSKEKGYDGYGGNDISNCKFHRVINLPTEDELRFSSHINKLTTPMVDGNDGDVVIEAPAFTAYGVTDEVNSEFVCVTVSEDFC